LLEADDAFMIVALVADARAILDAEREAATFPAR
jgi:hypothetical protein